MTRNFRHLLFGATLAAALAACATTGSSTGLSRGPSSRAVVAEYGSPPDSVIQVAWEVLRGDGVMARSFQRAAGDTTNVAQMETDWIYVPNVYPSAPLSGVAENERYVKLLLWAEPFRGGTRLYVEPLYNPVDLPTEPTQWARLRTLPNAHPSWQYVEHVGNEIQRRLGDD